MKSEYIQVRKLIIRKGQQVFLVLVYMPPDSAHKTEALNLLKQCLAYIDLKYDQYSLILMGDFNQDENSQQLKELKMRYAYIKSQCLQAPTRKNKCLDHIFTRNIHVINGHTLPPIGLSDHNTLMAETEVETVTKSKEQNNISKSHLEKMLNSINFERLTSYEDYLQLSELL